MTCSRPSCHCCNTAPSPDSQASQSTTQFPPSLGAAMTGAVVSCRLRSDSTPTLFVPDEGHPFLRQVKQRPRNAAEIRKEISVVRRQSGETSDLTHVSWSGPVDDSCYFGGVCLHSVLADDLPQKSDSSLEQLWCNNFDGFNFKPAALKRAKTCPRRSTCSSKLLAKQMTSST